MWSKADPHVHTGASDGFESPEEIMNYVVEHTDLRVIGFADHNTIAGAIAALEYKKKHPVTFKNLDIIIGEEISSKEGHIIGLYLETPVSPHMSAAQTIDEIHSQGAIAVAPHPFNLVLGSKGLEAVGTLVNRLPFDAVETRNSNPLQIFSNYLTEAVNYFTKKLPVTGGSDAHFLSSIGRCYTTFEGSTAQDFRNSIEKKLTRACGFVWGPICFARFLLEQRRKGFNLKSRYSQFQASRNDLFIEVADMPGINLVILRCAGNLGGYNAEILNEKIKSFMNREKLNLIVNLDKVPYIDNKGLSALSYAFEFVRKYRGNFILCNLQPQVENVLKELEKLDDWFEIYPEEGDAIVDVDRDTRY